MLIEAECPDKPFRKVYHSPVTYDNSFRHSCRTACKDTVNWIKVYYLRTDTAQQSLVFIERADIRVFQSETLETGFVQHRIIGISNCHGCYRIQHFRDEPHTLVRHPAVDRDIEISAFDHAHKTGKTFNPPVHEDKDRFPHCASGLSRDDCPHTLSTVLPLSIGQRILIVSYRCLVRPLLRRSVQIVKYIRHHHFFSYN